MQNAMLHQRISASLQMLKSVKDQMSELEKKKARVSALTGSPGADSTRKAAPGAAPCEAQNSGGLAGLLGHVTQREADIESFAGRAANPFDSIPVYRPVPAPATVAVPFGRARDPFTNSNKWHYGVDFAAPEKTPVFAAAAGQVVRSENDPVWGKRIVIDHKNGYSTVYAHLGRALVAKGRKVGRGDVIGEIGYSGLTTGPHVHYEIRRDSIPVDPEKYFFPLSAAPK